MATTLSVMRESIDEKVKRSDELADALNLALTTKPDAVERVREDADRRYTLSLYGATRAHGGIVVVRFDCRGQLPTVSARYFDAYRNEYAVREFTPLAIACDRLSVARQRKLDADGPFSAFRRKAGAR